MKVVILAGGYGTRLSEETQLIPKPMVRIGDKPILWHIMKIYSHYGFNEFVILLGYKGYIIKEYFANYFLHQSNVTIDIDKNKIAILDNFSEPWKISLINTGLNTMTGGRISRIKDFIGSEQFMLTYGDGLSDVNIEELLDTHEKSQKTVTMTAVQPEGRFGSLELSNDLSIKSFNEKPKGDGNWINGGFFICNPDVFNYLNNDDNEVFEKSPLERLAKDNKLGAYKHSSFWKPMDTLRDKENLNNLWDENKAPWKHWK